MADSLRQPDADDAAAGGQAGDGAGEPSAGWWRTPWARHALAGLGAGGAVALKLGLGEYFGPTYILFYPAVMLAALLLGLGPGLLATALTTLGAALWVVPLQLQGRPWGIQEVVGLVAFASMGVLMTAVAEQRLLARRRASQYRAERAQLEREGLLRKREDLALRRYELLAEHGRDLILFSRREDRRIIEANRAAVAAYGYPREELLGLALDELRAPETRAAVAGQFAEADRHGLRFETVHRRRDGSTFPVEVNAQATTLDGTRLIVSVIRDITERRAAEAGLQAAAAASERERAQLAAVFDAVADGISVFNARGDLVLANQAEARINGFASAAEMQRDLAFFAEVYRLSLPDGRELPVGDWPVARALRGEAVADLVLEGRRTDTGQTWTFSFSGQPIRGPGGEVALAVVVTRDITRRRRAEEALRRREEELAEAQRLVHVGSWYAPAGTDAIEASEELKALFGLRPSEPFPPFAKHRDLLYPAPSWDRLAAAVRGTLRTGEPCALEVPATRVDGTPLWVTARAELVRGPDGAVVGMRGTVQDITERTRTVQALAAERERLAVTLGSIGDAVIATDARARITDHNAVAEALTGWPAAEAVGRPLEEVFRIIAEDTREPRVSPVQRVLAEGVVVGLANHTALQARDGTERPIADSGAPIRDASGAVTGVVLVFRDQTEERNAERALQDSERRAVALFDRAPIPIVLSRRADGRVVSANDAFLRLFECTREEALGQTSLDLGLTDLDARARLMEELEREGRVRELEVRRRTHAGSELVLSLNVDPLRLGEEDLLLSSLQDLTRRRQAEQALKESEERFQQAQKLESIGRLAGGVAHDFNNLLTVILTCSDELEEQLAQHQPVSAEALQQIREAGERARDLTRQLLTFARKQHLAPVDLDLNAVVQGSEKLLRRLLGEDVTLEVALQPELWSLRADPGQVEQVLLNLAVNARDAMPRGGKLRLETSNRAVTPRPGAPLQVREWVCLAVEDSGTGMAPEVQAHLFEPFFTTKEPGKGTGLGLATVYGVVSQAGGHVEVRSTEGSGTRFEVWLPRSRRLDTPRPAASPPRSGRGQETLLLVEDDRQVREVAERALRAGGYRVLTAAHPRAALALPEADLRAVQLLVTDVVMPDLDGPTLARELVRRHPALRVLYVSGYTRDAAVERGVADSGLQLLDKPFTGPTLLARVRRLLDEPG